MLSLQNTQDLDFLHNHWVKNALIMNNAIGNQAFLAMHGIVALAVKYVKKRTFLAPYTSDAHLSTLCSVQGIREEANLIFTECNPRRHLFQ